MTSCPDIRQADDFDCGDAVVHCYCKKYKVTAPERLANSLQGLSPDTMEAALRSAGFNVISGNFLLDDLRYYTKDRMVACPHTAGGVGHWAIVVGVSRGYVRTHCPYDGPEKIRIADWLRQWTDSTRSGTAYENYGLVAWL
jgi:hypothetical protein